MSIVAVQTYAPAMQRKFIAPLIWLVVAVVLAGLPLVFRSLSAIGTLNQLGVLVIFALSYNAMLGLTGMLSFGHGMFFGFGGFVVIHAINKMAAAHIPLPLILMPIIGALASLALAAIVGWATTRRGGTVFAMITLGLGEMMYAATAIFKGFFGGEEGLTTDRSMLGRFFGFNFASQIEVYYLVLGWGLLSAFCLYFITRTPFGQLCTAVRENERRVEFLGYRPHVIRYMAFCIAAFFAGIAGGLAAINFEIMSASNLGGYQSALVLLMTFIGGTGHFVGPVIGGIVIGFMQTWLSDITPGWQLYFGLLFILVVMYAPGGIAGLLHTQARLLRRDGILRVLPGYALVTPTLAALGLGAIILIELGYQVGLKATEGNIVTLFGLAFDTHSAVSWSSGVVLLAGGVFGLRRALRFAVASAALERREDRT